MVATSSETGTRRRSTGKTRTGARVISRVVGIVVGLALAAAAVYAQTFTLSYEQRSSPLTVKGSAGELVETNRFSVKVTSVTAAHAVDTKDTRGEVVKVETSNLFLVVNVTATTPKEPMQLGTLQPPVLLTADGRRYKPTDKVDDSLTIFNKIIQPGLWSSGVLVFEVPEEALPGAGLVVSPPQGVIVVDTFAPEAEIDLGLSGDALTRLTSHAEELHSLVNKT
ncbi:DUF4352 domain-containing protein [Microtetraspora sp. NBRC 16547]|uniref:DUF4352 domain-containing protein n=1 Tax=Microtetraspora sp. NBRC 16547 TaxID=3030993 RepID=UPI0024A240E8|nr:DUF4352 domain-containing protein [Microtetraspora sp. NBRC 16547]GLW96433.1 hypothetical protein Misp02_05200 [Microtetraspora sp. NBRC 16547]